MAYASRQGRARISSSAPQAAGVCDRCGFVYSHSTLRFQYDWRGTSLRNLRFLVCDTCYDEPQQQLRAIVIPADPVPIDNPRIEYFVADSTNQRVISGRVRDIVSLTSNGTSATITYTAPTTPPAVGSAIYISGVTPSGYNGEFAVTSATRTSITYATTFATPYVSGGQVSINGVAIDPVVGIPVYEPNVRITQNDDVRVTQQTGEPPGGLNQQPGTDPNAPGDNNPGLPYNDTQVPQTGPL